MNLLLDNIFSEMGVLAWAFVIVSILLGIAYVVASVVRLFLIGKYHRFNRTRNANGVTGRQSAEMLLQGLGYEDVQVVKSGWIMSAMFGNIYFGFRKKIRLRKYTADKDSITSVGVATQKVGLVMQDKNGEKGYKFIKFWQPLVVLAPFMTIPLILVGLLVDLVFKNTNGLFTIIFALIAFLYFLGSFIFTLVTIPVEKKANKYSIEVLQKTNMLLPDEVEKVRQLQNLYIAMYIIDFIIAVLYVIQMILKILLKLAAAKLKDSN